MLQHIRSCQHGRRSLRDFINSFRFAPCYKEKMGVVPEFLSLLLCLLEHCSEAVRVRWGWVCETCRSGSFPNSLSWAAWAVNLPLPLKQGAALADSGGKTFLFLKARDCSFNKQKQNKAKCSLWCSFVEISSLFSILVDGRTGRYLKNHPRFNITNLNEVLERN